MNSLFERVRAIPIESVIREYFPNLELKHSGRDLIAICPFHDEKTPSFKVDFEKNRWHCFGTCAKGGSNIDLLLMGELATQPLDAAKALALKFEIDIDDEKRKRKIRALTVAQYADFCVLPESFLAEKFSLANGDTGVEIPYRNEHGEVLSVQRRHRLEKAKTKDGRFSWRKKDKPIPYGLWLSAETKARLVVVEGASDVHVLIYCGIPALGIPGASTFKPAMVSALASFAELVLIQEPGEAGEKFVQSITAALKAAEYKGAVRAVSLTEKDPRALWLAFKDKTQFADALTKTIEATTPIDLYPQVPLTKNIIHELADQIRRFIFFKGERVPLLIATWILATYVHERFQYFAILWITSPVLRCGKTRLIDILDQLVWRSSGSVVNTSLAALYYMTAEGCTFLADEVENLKNSDKEQFGAVIGIVNGGFAKGATVRRMVKVEGDWVQKKFPIYGPKVLAGIATVSDTIRDRSLCIRMIRKSPKERTERLSMRKEGPRFKELRAILAQWAEQNSEAIEKIYDSLKEQPELRGCDDRFLDIAEPLLSIVRFADAEAANGGKRILDELMPLLKEMGGLRDEAQNDEAIAALCGLLDAMLGGVAEVFIPSDELLEKMKGTAGLQWIHSTKAMATFMSKLDLVSRRNSSRTKRGYLVTKEAVQDIRLRYIVSSPDFEASDVRDQAGRGSEGIL
jgi:hypothetical protein